MYGVWSYRSDGLRCQCIWPVSRSGYMEMDTEATRSVMACCVRRAWHDLAGVWCRAAWDVFETCVRWVCQREKTERAWKQLNISKLARQGVTVAQGVIEKHHGGVRSYGKGLRAVLWRRTYLPAADIIRIVAGAFSSDLVWRWHYFNVKGLIWDMNEVFVHLPWMGEAAWSCWSTRFGGVEWQTQEEVQDSNYSEEEGNFEQISAINAWVTITNWFTLKVSLVGRDVDLENIVAKK